MLIGPIGTSASDVLVDFSWQRVDGAIGYRLRAWHGSPAGYLVLDQRTVNDRHIGLINLAGGIVHWSVAAIGSDGIEGPASSATFTSARLAPQLEAPSSGEVITHPDESLVFRARGVVDQPMWLYADQNIGSPDPPTDLAGTFGPGTWRWRMHTPVWPGGTPEPAASETRTFSIEWPDSVPQLTAPSAGTVVPEGTPLRLTWHGVRGAARYEWQLNRQSGTVLSSGPQGTETTWADIPGTVAAGNYTWRVRAIFASGTELQPIAGAWSSQRSLAISAGPDPAPLSPVDGATLADWPTLRWSDVPAAVSYEIQIAPTPDSSGQTRTSPIAAVAFGPPRPVFDIYTAFAGGDTRSWRVRAILVDGASDWSAWRSFTVAPAGGTLSSPTPATLLGPADCASSACPDLPGIPILRWEPVAGASFYRVFFRWDGTSGPANSWTDTAGTSMPFPGTSRPALDERAAWAVLACASDQACSTTMPAQRRHFGLSLPAPGVLGPSDGSTSAQPNIALSWQLLPAPSDPDVLRLPERYVVETVIHGIDGGERSRRTDFHGRTTVTTVPPIPHGNSVTWRVRAAPLVNWGPAPVGRWSASRTVTRDEPPLTLLTPSAGVTADGFPLLSWSEPGFAVGGFDVELVKANHDDAFGPETVGAANARGLSTTVANELSPGEYRWRVRRITGSSFLDEGAGRWSSVGRFTVPGDPKIQLLGPAAGTSVRGDDVVLSWAPYPGADQYALLIGTTPNLTYDSAIYRSGSAGTVHTVTETLPAGTLYWLVCAGQNCSLPTALPLGTSDVRAMSVTAVPSTDKTAPSTTGPVRSLYTGNALSAGRVPVKLAWTGSDGAGSGIARYELRQQTDGGSWSTVASNLTSASTVRHLAPGHSYRFAARAIDRAGNTGAWAYGATFTVAGYQQSSTTVRYAGTWRSGTSTSWWGGSARYSSSAGATATFTATGRSFALVASRGPTRGKATILQGSTVLATIDLYSATTQHQRIVWSRNWSSSATRSITVRVSGTAGRPTVVVDGFAVVR